MQIFEKDIDNIQMECWFFVNNCDKSQGKEDSMYEIIKQLCDKNDISISKLCEIVTNSTGNLATWKKGYMRSDYLQKVADYFQVSTDYLLGREPQNIIVTESDHEKQYDETTNQVSEAFSKLSFSDKAKVMNLIAELSEKNDE